METQQKHRSQTIVLVTVSIVTTIAAVVGSGITLTQVAANHAIAALVPVLVLASILSTRIAVVRSKDIALFLELYGMEILAVTLCVLFVVCVLYLVLLLFGVDSSPVFFGGLVLCLLVSLNLSWSSQC